LIYPSDVDLTAVGRGATTNQMISTFENPYYYLKNFDTVLGWVRERSSDLLNQREIDFIENFSNLSVESRALFVRMIMRKGSLFRASKLNYKEIRRSQEAIKCLIDLGWVENDPVISLEQLFALLTKKEVVHVFGLSRHKSVARKMELLDAMQVEAPEPRRFSSWFTTSDDPVYEVRLTHLCDRIRLMFFGNLHQDWSEFILSDLGVLKYEKVTFLPTSRAFHSRQDVDDYLHLHDCRERFYKEEALGNIENDIYAVNCENSWLRSRRDKLLFHIAQRYEQLEEWTSALRIYKQSSYPGGRIRIIRILEKNAQYASAMEMAALAEAAPESEMELQQLKRIMPRLRRKLGHPVSQRPLRLQVTRIDLKLPRPDVSYSIEELVRRHVEQISPNAPVHYVENTLVNSLFGLLCWDAIFIAIPGAFFHPFHIGPTDLHSADFYCRRSMQFKVCLSQLDSEQYKQTIRQNFKQKMGIQSPFVTWQILTDTLLERALSCLPAAHLGKWFERILLDIQSNRAGFPDLIQFWPEKGRYRMIEVKGPGDKLQDNQIRWLDYCMTHDMPVAVCYVQWENTGE
jgi:hypothetical protein